MRWVADQLVVCCMRTGGKVHRPECQQPGTRPHGAIVLLVLFLLLLLLLLLLFFFVGVRYCSALFLLMFVNLVLFCCCSNLFARLLWRRPGILLLWLNPGFLIFFISLAWLNPWFLVFFGMNQASVQASVQAATDAASTVPAALGEDTRGDGEGETPDSKSASATGAVEMTR